MALPDDFVFSAANISQCDEIYALESESFPEDEAATLASITMRCTEAGDFFFVLMHKSAVIGFINGTLCEGEEILHDSMTEHVNTGSTLVIHSVTISSEYRRRGLAKSMLRLYVRRERVVLRRPTDFTPRGKRKGEETKRAPIETKLHKKYTPVHGYVTRSLLLKLTDSLCLLSRHPR